MYTQAHTDIGASSARAWRRNSRSSQEPMQHYFIPCNFNFSYRCKFCQGMEEEFEKFAGTYGSKIEIAKYRGDEDREFIQTAFKVCVCMCVCWCVCMWPVCMRVCTHMRRRGPCDHPDCLPRFVCMFV